MSGKGKVSYEVHLFVRNCRGELLLIYDQPNKRFVVPYRMVEFDEIPTKVVCIIMDELRLNAKWDYDYHYHAADRKYDRVRDDIAPMYIYDVLKRSKKKSVLCYALDVRDGEYGYSVKKEYPFLEFYSLQEIRNMGEDIRPSQADMQILEILGREEQNECTQESI